MKEELEHKIEVGISLASDFSTQVEKKGAIVKFSLPVYCGSNLPFFEEIREEVLNLVKEQEFNFTYNQFFIIVSKEFKRLDDNLSYFPSKDLIINLEQEDSDLLEFEAKVTNLQSKVEEIIREYNLVWLERNKKTSLKLI